MENEVKGKFLRDLNLQVGDVVECVGESHNLGEGYIGATYTIKAEHPEFKSVGMCAWRKDGGYVPVYSTYQPTMLFKVVSKVQPKTFGELSPEEKGALLLAHHEGEIIEWSFEGTSDWSAIEDPLFSGCHVYRVKPKPEIKENTLYTPCGDYLIKYDTVDGVPDTNSVKMEKTND